jgi:hypothetical protein
MNMASMIKSRVHWLHIFVFLAWRLLCLQLLNFILDKCNPAPIQSQQDHPNELCLQNNKVLQISLFYCKTNHNAPKTNGTANIGKIVRCAEFGLLVSIEKSPDGAAVAMKLFQAATVAVGAVYVD